jgi:hypothetical protein
LGSARQRTQIRTARLDGVVGFKARTRWCCGALQHVPYVKTMFGAVMALKGACSQAMNNKERSAALAECVRWRSEHA